MDLDDRDNKDRGLGLGLLILIALLLCGNLYALIQLGSKRTANDTPGQSAQENDPEFSRLMLADLVLGAMDLDKSGPQDLRLTADQRRCLQGLEAQIAERFKRNDRSPGPLDAEVRNCLTAQQKSYLLGRFEKNPPPRDLTPFAGKLHDFLKGP